MTEGTEPTPPTGHARAQPPRGPTSRSLEDTEDLRDGRLLGAGRHEADELALDQVFFPLQTPAFAAFQALLADPPAPSMSLRRLLRTRAPWE